MNKIVILVAIIIISLTSFVMGLTWEYAAHRQEISDVEETARESCSVRIATIKETCKK